MLEEIDSGRRNGWGTEEDDAWRNTVSPLKEYAGMVMTVLESVL